MDNAKTNDDKLFKFILKCCRNHYKPDVHTFYIDIDNGRAYVECRQHDVYMEFYLYDGSTAKWCGPAVAAASRLENYGAKYESIDM